MKKLALIVIIFITLALPIALASSTAYAQATMESYEDSGCTIVCNDFTAGKNQVWMKAIDLSAPNKEYKTAFYDASATGGGTFIAYDINTAVVKTLTGATVIFTDYPSSVGDGDWHAVVLYPSTTAAPPTYNEAIALPEYEVHDAFYVHQAAIPEFPTIMAAIGVAGLCFGIYYRMRKGRLAHVQA